MSLKSACSNCRISAHAHAVLVTLAVVRHRRKHAQPVAVDLKITFACSRGQSGLERRLVVGVDPAVEVAQVVLERLQRAQRLIGGIIEV